MTNLSFHSLRSLAKISGVVATYPTASSGMVMVEVWVESEQTCVFAMDGDTLVL